VLGALVRRLPRALRRHRLVTAQTHAPTTSRGLGAAGRGRAPDPPGFDHESTVQGWQGGAVRPGRAVPNSASWAALVCWLRRQRVWGIGLAIWSSVSCGPRWRPGMSHRWRLLGSGGADGSCDCRGVGEGVGAAEEAADGVWGARTGGWVADQR
jgi:hypothetical protein